MSGIKTFKPRLKVVLVKGVIDQDSRYVGGSIQIGEMIDLTPHVGDGGYVTTHKSIYQPVGAFEVVLPDKPLGREGFPGGIDSLWGVIEPFDSILIGMARNVGIYDRGFQSWMSNSLGPVWGYEGIPLVMSGFVRKVVRDESIDSGGRPNRRIVIQGTDYGCIGEIAQVSRIGGVARDMNMMPLYTIDQLGLKAGVMTAREYVEALRRNMLGKQIEYMRATMPFIFDIKAASPVVINGKEHGIVTQGNVVVNAMSDFDGTCWTIMHKHADTPWNELFIEDRCNPDTGELGPYLVYRPTPYKDYKSGFIDMSNPQAYWSSGAINNMDQELYADVVLDTSAWPLVGAYQERSDAHVSNIYWVPIMQSQLWGDRMLNEMLTRRESVIDSTAYPRTNIDIFGPRVMNVESRLTYSDSKLLPLQEIAENQEKAIIGSIAWADKRRKWLQEANKDNVGFSSGALRVVGFEKLRPGCYYSYMRGQMAYTQYITEVHHTFAPYRHYSTTMNYIRGDNYYQRIVEKQPHLKEGHVGAYAG